jgi:hypothetical protein
MQIATDQEEQRRYPTEGSQGFIAIFLLLMVLIGAVTGAAIGAALAGTIHLRLWRGQVASLKREHDSRARAATISGKGIGSVVPN